MKKYMVTIESIFVSLPGESRHELYGYFSTFEAMAGDAKQALQEARWQLSKLVDLKGLRTKDSGLFKTRYIVDDLWEAVDDPSLPDFVGGGFVFFRITSFSTVILLGKFALARLARPHLVFSLPGGNKETKGTEEVKPLP